MIVFVNCELVVNALEGDSFLVVDDDNYDCHDVDFAGGRVARDSAGSEACVAVIFVASADGDAVDFVVADEAAVLSSLVVVVVVVVVAAAAADAADAVLAPPHSVPPFDRIDEAIFDSISSASMTAEVAVAPVIFVDGIANVPVYEYSLSS
mmetsp:Transcript_5195/g.10009  ORF Transcript_5195/g.10009 Transcript_5195/m.10009 type:complete len:151 (-) Transcript_5195:427-879(-)